MNNIAPNGIEELKAELASKQAEQNQYRDHLAALWAQLAETEATIKYLVQETAAVEERIKELTANAVGAGEQLDKLLSVRNRMTEHSNTYRQKHKELYQSCCEMEEAIAKLEYEIGFLKHVIADAEKI